jgi:hypothetical protein
MLWMKYIKDGFTEELAEKLGCKVYKEGVGLFVWNYEVTSAEVFIIESCMKINFITGTIFGNGEGTFGFTFVC